MDYESTNPWDDPTTDERDADEAPVRGFSWETLSDISGTPTRVIPTIIRMACLLIGEANKTGTPQTIAKKLKVTEIAIYEAISQMPTLFALTAGGHRVKLTAPDAGPNIRSPRIVAAEAKVKRQEDRLAAKEAAQTARDEEDTPFNRLGSTLESCGMERQSARSFAGLLVRTYPIDAATAAAGEAARTSPGNTQSYILAILKARLSISGIRGPRRVPAQTRPTGTRETRPIGWSSSKTEPRAMLYRMPDGRIKTSPPPEGVVAPSFADDPGIEVLA